MPAGTDDVLEELPDAGPRRPLWPWLAALALIGVVAAVVQLSHGDDVHRAARPAPAPSRTSPSPSPSVTRDDEYVIDVPAQDMRDALADPACRDRCTAHALTGAALTSAAAGFTGLRPLAGGLVTRRGTGDYLRSVEGYAAHGTVVHLYSQRVSAPDSAIRSTDSRGQGYRTVELALIRGGWRLDVTLVADAATPPIDAATTWLRTSPLPS